jgi:hypothetical protein
MEQISHCLKKELCNGGNTGSLGNDPVVPPHVSKGKSREELKREKPTTI